jgi:hypothetical protein
MEMESGGAVYARVPAGGATALDAAIRQARGERLSEGPLGVIAYEPAGHAFALVDRWGRPDDMPAWAEESDLAMAKELVALSALVGEVVGFYEVEDSTGLYAVWREGVLVRELVWTEAGWSRVEGEAQPWETGLFAPELLERALEDARDSGRDEAPIRESFGAGRIVVGATWPGPHRMAELIRTAIKAPAHGLAPWPRRRDVVKQLRSG